MYCVDCYYLVSAKSYLKTSVSLIVHYLDSPIPIRSDKIVHDSINANETIQYIYYASKPFNVSLDIVYGSFNVTVKTLTTEVYTKNMSSSGHIAVFNLGP